MKTKIYLLLFILALAGTSTQAKKRFYDSKSNVVGISGYYEDFTEGLTTKKYVKNDINVKIPEEKNLRYGKVGYKREETIQAINKAGIGKKVLDLLFQRSSGHLSESLLKERALLNAQLADVERAKAGLIDAETILKEDYLPILENNYIFLRFFTNDQKCYWLMLHVDITKETLDEVFRCWDNLAEYDKIHVPVSYVASGKTPYSSKQWMKMRRKLSRKVPAMAIRGQVLGNHPVTADVSKADGLKSKDRMFVYRQFQKSNGEMYSKKISTVRVTKVGEQAQMHVIGGRTPSYKKGDMAVFHPDRRSAFDITYGREDASVNYSLTYDKTVGFKKGGISHHILVKGGIGKYDGKEVYLHNGVLYNAPGLFQAALGYGLGFTFLNRVELMPYFMAQAHLMYFYEYKGSKDIKDAKTEQYLRVPVGVKLNINIWRPVQLTVGAEYNAGLAHNTDDSKLGNKYLRLSGDKINGFGFYGGLRFNF